MNEITVTISRDYDDQSPLSMRIELIDPSQDIDGIDVWSVVLYGDKSESEGYFEAHNSAEAVDVLALALQTVQNN